MTVTSVSIAGLHELQGDSPYLEDLPDRLPIEASEAFYPLFTPDELLKPNKAGLMPVGSSALVGVSTGEVFSSLFKTQNCKYCLENG